MSKELLTIDLSQDNAKEAFAAAKLKAPRYGTSVLIVYSWFVYKLETQSLDLQEILSHLDEGANPVIRVHNLLKKDILVSDMVSEPVLLGCNIVMPSGMTIKRSDVQTAISLYVKQHPLVEYLDKVIDTLGSVNSFECKGLKTLLSKIDFPIPY